MPESIRIVTINSAKGDGPYMRRLDLLAEGLGALNPDIVLLQEALDVTDGSIHTTRELATRLDLDSVYTPARRKQRLVEGQRILCSSGLGFLSRLPVIDTTRLALPFDEADGERVAQFIVAEWDSKPLLFINLHLSHLPGRDDLRRDQIRVILEHPWCHREWKLRIVGGDFNTVAADLPSLFSETGGWDWRDCYVVGGGCEPRATVPVAACPEKGRCIDFILSLAHDSGAHLACQNAAVVLSGAKGDVYPSDHRGVMVDLVRPDVVTQ